LDRVSRELEQAQQRTSQLELELANLREAKATAGSVGELTDLKRQVENLNMDLQDALNENERLRMTIGQLGIGFG
jgi:hypothetical protein